MKKIFLLFFLIVFTLLFFNPKAYSADSRYFCPTDVTIAEGSSISFCQGQFVTINASAGFVSYAWTGPVTGANPSLAPTISGQYVVTAIDGLGCSSSDTIVVTVHPNPVGVIFSSEGNQICPGSTGTTLSLTQPFSSYLWDNGSTSPAIQVTQGGIYAIQAIDFNGCIANSSINITQPNFTLTTASTTVCNGSSTTLTGNGGTSYSWSTGEINSSIIVAPPVAAMYSVIISNGNCTDTIYQLITIEEMPASGVNDTFYVAAGDNIFINGPDGYTSYSWSPQTDLSSYNSQGVVFSGLETTEYIVNSSHTNGCLRNDPILVIVVRLTIPTGFSPNGDLINDVFEIPELDVYKAKVKIFNRWGDIVFQSDHYNNDWNGTCKTAFCAGSGLLPEGTYFYSIEVEKVHFDGYTTIKR